MGKKDKLENLGQWSLYTAGEFLGIVVDGGDNFVIARLIDESEPNDDGKFYMKWEIVTAPAEITPAVVDLIGVKKCYGRSVPILNAMLKKRFYEEVE